MIFTLAFFFKTIRTVFLTDFLCSWLYLFYLCTYEILMWLSFGIRPAKNEHKRLLILKIQSPLVTAFGLSFFLSPKVGNSFQTAKHHSKKPTYNKSKKHLPRNFLVYLVWVLAPIPPAAQF